MSSHLNKRAAKLEKALSRDAIGSGVWHRLIWDVGQGFDDMLDQYGRDRIKPDDGVIIRNVIDAEDAKPVADPIHERDREKADNWLRERRINALS